MITLLAATLFSASCSIRLLPIEDPVGEGREWFRMEWVGDSHAQVPAFTIKPQDTWLEQWKEGAGNEDPRPGPGNLAWFAGPPGTYILTATVACGASASYRVVIP
jgi:hypothetical protein